MMTNVWFIGPESQVYHTNADCPALHKPGRYWPVDRGTLRDGAIIPSPSSFHTRRIFRRECKLCARGRT